MKNSKPGRETKTKKPATKQARTAGKPGVHKQAELRKPSANSAGAEDQHSSDIEIAAGEDLETKCEAIRTLESAFNHHELESRYAIAEICRSIAEGDGEGKVYGTHAVETAADKLGWPKSQIYSFAKIAQSWTLTEVLELEKSKGWTWAHLLLVAGNKVEPHREKLVRQEETTGANSAATQSEDCHPRPTRPAGAG